MARIQWTVKPELAEIMDEIHVQFPQAATRQHRVRFHDFRSKARRWFCERAGCKLPEGAGRLGKYCKRICDQTVSFQPRSTGACFRSSFRTEIFRLPTMITSSSPASARRWRKRLQKLQDMCVDADGLKPFTVTLGELTDEERQIILKGCLINYNRVEK